MGVFRPPLCGHRSRGAACRADLGGAVRLLAGTVVALDRSGDRGAVHDIVVLFASMRRKGKSLSEVAKEELGPVAGFCTGLAMLFIITITMAGLSMVVLHALERNPWGRSPLRLQFRSRWGLVYFIKRQAT